MYNENNFLKALSKSFEFGARSTEKLKPVHLFLANTLQNIFGQGYEMHYLGENSKELTIEGKYHLPLAIGILLVEINETTC